MIRTLTETDELELGSTFFDDWDLDGHGGLERESNV